LATFELLRREIASSENRRDDVMARAAMV